MSNPTDKAIGNANFITAAKMIELNHIQPALVEDVMRQQLQRNRLKYAYPANIGNAQIHQNAYKFGYNTVRRGEPPRVCPCCLERVQTEQIGICYRTSKVEIQQEMGYSDYKLRPGISLFFSFIKMATFYLLLRFLVFDAFNLITNISGQYCQNVDQNQCEDNLWNMLSTFNKKNNSTFMLIHDILSLVLIVVSILFFFFYRKRQYNKAKILNDKNQAEEDYAILVQNIPLIDFPSKNDAKKRRVNQEESMELYHRQHLWKYFDLKVKHWVQNRKSGKVNSGNNEKDFLKLINKNNGQLRSQDIVKSISLCYNLQRLETLENERSELIKNNKKYEKLRREIEDQNDDFALGIQQIESDNRFSSVPKQVEFLNDCEIILNKQYASDNSVLFNITNFVGKALISFQYQHYRQFILQEAERDINFLVFNGNRLKVSRVSNPRDVNWKNLRHSEKKQKKKTFATVYILLLITFICLGLLTASQFGRIQAEKAAKNDQNLLFGKIGQYGFVGLSILIILIANQIILSVTRKRARQQCHYSKTSQSHSTIIRTVIFQFICTAILPYIVSRIFSSPLASKTGLIFQITCLIIIYALIINLLSIVFPKAIWRSANLFFKYRGKKAQHSVDKFQIELNQQYQYVEFDIINRYANYLILVFTASFYSYLIPVTIPFLAISFFIQFWIDKLNLFQRSSHPRNFSFYLTRNILKIFQSSIFVFAVGVVLWGLYIHDTHINILNLIALLAAGLYLWFLLGASIRLERKLFGGYESSQSVIYDDCVIGGKFEETYWTENPATFLVKESDVTGKQHIYNPGLNKVFVTSNTYK